MSEVPMQDNDMDHDNGIPVVQQHQQEQLLQHSILFYRYHPLTSDPNQIEVYRASLELLCSSLNLCGRILVGASKTEGINGTLAGQQDGVRAFTWALLGDETSVHRLGNEKKEIQDSVLTYWDESKAFFEAIGEERLTMNSADDFKWSVSRDTEPLFPDLHIVVRKELIGSGGDLSDIPLQETATGYLTPSEWHTKLAHAARNENTVVIDCRNTKEFEIGRFEGALDPQTTTFSQFPQWVQHNKALLSGKEVLMYCTGGIRCEKASAYIRRSVPNVGEVNHLKGGIHKYLEAYGGSSDSLWHGRNFIFDRRQAVSAQETHLGKDGIDSAMTAPITSTSTPANTNANESSEIVGECVYCEAPFDEFDARCVCTVCREPLLACTKCQNRREFHCRQHFHLRKCYFSYLEPFTTEELLDQKKLLVSALEEIAVGKKFKQKRKTLLKQLQRVQERLHEISAVSGVAQSSTINKSVCRNCDQGDCAGNCWGFFGLKRKGALESTKKGTDSYGKGLSASTIIPRQKRQRQKEQEIAEIVRCGLFQPCSSFRDPETGVRVPPCTTRELKCHVKGKWCGRLIVDVVQEEFQELSRPERLQSCLRHRLLRLNGSSIDEHSVAQIKLKSSDVLSRVLHWHEAPVVVPTQIGVQKVGLPAAVAESYDIALDDASIYVCDKPSTIPVHPAGPYFANVLTFLVEAQIGLPPQSLHPVHRTDRVTSGLTLCCTNPKVARIFHRSLSEASVQKMYLAKIRGRFPSSASEVNVAKTGVTWLEEFAAIEVDAPVHTSDPANGMRVVSREGKDSRSRFKLLEYNAEDNTSIISCFPLTGRNHQLRVHLSWIGFPIVNDIQYGGNSPKDNSEGEKILAQMQQAAELETQQSDTESKKACAVCQDKENGIRTSFTPAQLLLHGHAIFLHAYRYEVTFLVKKQKKAVTSAEYSIGLPSWVGQVDKKKLSWLK